VDSGDWATIKGSRSNSDRDPVLARADSGQKNADEVLGPICEVREVDTGWCDFGKMGFELGDGVWSSGEE